MKRTYLTLATALLAAGLTAPLNAQAFGNSIAIGDGEMFVGEPTYDMRSGVVYVFEQNAVGVWSQVQRLEPAAGEAENRFGIRVATQDDVLLVSATRADDGTGAIYVYRDQGGMWTESGRLETDDRSPADSLGSGLAIDGDWVMIGTIGQNGGRGAAYAFRRQGDTWVQHSKIAPDGLEAAARFGVDIALEGDQMLISAIGAGEGAGAVYGYAYDAGADSWEATGQIEAPLLAPQTGFGSDIAISDGVALIGAPGVFQGTGAAFMFALTPSDGWQLVTLVTPFETTGGTAFGSSIAFDGRTALIGASGSRGGEGRIFAYTLDPETLEWTDASQVGSGQGGRESCAATVALAGDRAVSAPHRADPGAGAAIVLEKGANGWETTDRISGDVLGYEAVTGDEVRCSEEGAAVSWECDSVDLVSFLPLSELGADRGVRTNDVWGWTDPESGREIVLVGMSNQTAFVDVTNASFPTYLGRLPMPEGARASTWRDMKVFDDHMFVVSDGAGDHGMQVFDLTRLRDEDGTNPPTFDADVHYTDIASAHNIAINEETGFAYSVGSSGGGETCGGGLHMINIQDPVNPYFAGCFSDMTSGRRGTGYSHDAQCVIYRGPDEDYQGHELCFGSNETHLSIADVTDKDNPVSVALVTYPNVAYSHQGWLTEDHSYFFMGDELDESGDNVEFTRTLIWDLEDLDDPVLAREYLADTKATDHNLYILGNTMYQSNYNSGLRVLDVSDPLNPVPVGHFDTVPYGGDTPQMNGSWSNYPYFQSGLVVVTSGSEGLFLVRYRPRTISQ
ncbi:MAG: choice-of-anchor B family protein [Gemmatimonadota bacterium]|nr:choice-of-anchor B family protein [Gemmatimonadota bacterium]